MAVKRGRGYIAQKIKAHTARKNGYGGYGGYEADTPDDDPNEVDAGDIVVVRGRGWEKVSNSIFVRDEGRYKFEVSRGPSKKFTFSREGPDGEDIYTLQATNMYAALQGSGGCHRGQPQLHLWVVDGWRFRLRVFYIE